MAYWFARRPSMRVADSQDELWGTALFGESLFGASSSSVPIEPQTFDVRHPDVTLTRRSARSTFDRRAA